MVKLKGPAASTEASGKLANALIFSSSKSAAYLKKHAKPRNPKTPKQVSIRACMCFLAENWRNLTAPQQQTWADRAKRINLYPYHAFVKTNMLRWHTFHAPGKTDPVTGGKITLGQRATTTTGGVGMVTYCIYAPHTPKEWGWVIHRSQSPPWIPRLDTAIGLLPKTIDPGWNCYVDTPLAPGTYYYMRQTFLPDGTLYTDTRVSGAVVT